MLAGRYFIINDKEERIGVIDVSDGGRITLLEINDDSGFVLPESGCLTMRLERVSEDGVLAVSV